MVTMWTTAKHGWLWKQNLWNWSLWHMHRQMPHWYSSWNTILHWRICPGERQSVEGCTWQAFAFFTAWATCSFCCLHPWPYWPLDYLLHTIEGIAPLFQLLEDSIRQLLIPAPTGQNGISDLECDLLAQPACHDGLGLVSPTTLLNGHAFLLCLTAPLTAIIAL